MKKTLKKLVVFWIAAVMMFESAAPIRAYALPLPEQEEAEEAEEEILCADGLTAEEYAEKKEEYLAKEGKQSESPSKSASGYIGNSYIKAYINGDGNYNIGTTDNDCLLYHFPDGKTSQTLIRVDGYDYYFDDYCSNVTVGEEEATAVAVIDGVTVTQTLKVVTNPNSSTPNVIRISYSCVNNTSESKTIGVRIMLDTMLGSNDGAPFKVNGSAVQSEIEFSGNSIPRYYQAFDNLNDPNLVATGYTYYTNDEKPDKVQFAEWPEIENSSWNYQVTTGNILTGDSAFASYFNEKTVIPGETRTAVTYYGAYNTTGSGKFDVFDFDEDSMDQDLAIFCAEMAAFAYESIQGYWEYDNGWSHGSPSSTDSPKFFYNIDDVGFADLKNFNRSYNLYQYLKAYKFKDISSYNYAEPSENSATYTLAWKKVNHNGQVRDLIVVAIRGTNEIEWKGNMNVTGTSYASQALHESFQNGARMIESALMRYMNEHTSIQNPLVVIGGHSRGGAVGNLLAANLINGEVSRISSDSVYAYLFAVPNCTTDYDKNTTMDPIYKAHIYNFCFKDDFVPSMPFIKWGYYKYGTTNVQNAEKAMKKSSEFKALENLSLEFSEGRKPSFSTAETKRVVKKATEKWKTTERYYNKNNFENPPTLYKFMHDVVAPAAYGGTLEKATLLSHTWISAYSAIADFFVDGTSARKSVNDTHQMYTYYNALKTGVFDQASLSPTFKNAKKASDTASSAPKSIYSSVYLENTGKKAGTTGKTLTAAEQEQLVLIDFAQTGANLEKLGWDLQDCDTWTGITWTEDGRVSEIDFAYLGLEGALDLTVFSELVELDVAGNNLESLILPSPDATVLAWLVCSGNKLKSLDIEGQPLELLICDNNYLDETLISEQAADIESVSVSPQRVENAVYSENDISALRSILTNEEIWDLSANPEEWFGVQWELIGDNYHVVELDISESSLSGSLNVSELAHLRWLNCQKNEFESIDFSGCSELTFLNCTNNKLTSVTGNEALEYFYCDNNYLSSEVIESVGAENTFSGNQNVILSLGSIAEEERDILGMLAESLGQDASDPGQWMFVTWKKQGETWYAERLDLSGQSGISGDVDLSGFTYLTDVSFSGTSVESVILPNSITEIPAGAFFDCQELTKVVMPEGIVSIGDRAFSECSKLEYLVFSDTLSHVGTDTFVNDTSLITVFFSGNAPTFGEDVFVGTSIDFRIMYKEGTTGWDDEALEMVIPSEYKPLMIRSYPEKTEYLPGEDLDLTGMDLLYIDGSTSVEVVTDGYQVSDVDLSTPGEKTVEITYKGETATLEIHVRKWKISECDLRLEQFEFTYTGSVIRPDITVTNGDRTLIPDVDYTVSYENSVECGSTYLTVNGIGNCEGSQEVSFMIVDDRKIEVTDPDQLESDHSYHNYSSAIYSYEYAMDGIDGFDLVFNDNCYLESGYDYLVLLDSNGDRVQSWTGNSLAGRTVSIDGTKFSLKLESDASVTNWGFKVDKVIPHTTAAQGALSASVSGKTVSLAWEAVPNAESYTVYRLTEEGYWTMLDTVTVTEYIDKGAEFSTSYVYRVTWSENGQEYISSAYSSGVRVKTEVLPGKTSRGDMFNLASSVKVTWNKVPGAKYYKVYREGITDPSESLEEPVFVTTKLIGYDSKAGLTNGHAYKYKIVASLTKAGDSSGDSPLSYSKLMYRLKTVAIRSAKNTAAGKVTVKYDKTTSGDGYVLQYSEHEDMSNAKTKVIPSANTTTCVLSGFKKGKTYYISIRVRKIVNGIAYYTTFGVARKVKITK